MDRLLEIKLPIADELCDFKKLFDSSLTGSNPLLDEVIAYIKQRNGKMMRPVLVFLIAKLFGQINSSTLHAAVALELLHTASLVHDDVVDESTERRGQLSVNATYDNKVAILVGDYLLATCLVQAGKTENSSIIDVIASLGQDLSEGELLQLSNVKCLEFSEDVYYNVIRKKTAALFSACTKVAAISVHSTPRQLEKARLFGEYAGICFQIKDDIFDYFENKDLGKPTGNDMMEGKLTLPVIYALNSTDDCWAKEVAVKVKNGTASVDEIACLIEFTKLHGGIEYALKAIDCFKEKALSLLDDQPESQIKSALISYLFYVVEREK